MTFDEQVALWASFGVPEDYARLLTGLELKVDAGSQEKLHEDPNARVGVVGIREWLTKHKELFEVAN